MGAYIKTKDGKEVSVWFCRDHMTCQPHNTSCYMCKDEIERERVRYKPDTTDSLGIPNKK